MIQNLIDLDTQLFLFLNSHHTLFWDQFMYLYSGKWEWVLFYASIIYVLFKNYKPKQVLFILLTVAAVIACSDAITSQVLRPIFCRLRPSNLDNPISSMVHIVNGHRGGSYGFPSCHSANSWGLTFFLIFLLRNRVHTILLTVWAVTICYSRIYLGVHYPGDLLAGMFVGLFWGFLGYYILTRLTKQREAATRSLYVPVYAYLATSVVITSAAFVITT